MKRLYFYENLRFKAGKILSLYSKESQCFLCGKGIFSEGRNAFLGGLCVSCTGLLTRTATLVFSEKGRCLKCGRPLVSKHEICSECGKKLYFSYLDRAFPLFPYQGWGRNFMTSWKLSEERNLVFFPAEILGIIIKMFFPGYTLVPVPPRKGKLRSTGWDQIDDLCRILERVYGVENCPALRRTNYLQQKKLDRLHRINGLKGKIEVSVTGKKKIGNGSKVLLVDDVMTTGSTLETCAEVLKGLGAGRVEAVVLFYD